MTRSITIQALSLRRLESRTRNRGSIEVGNVPEVMATVKPQLWSKSTKKNGLIWVAEAKVVALAGVAGVVALAGVAALAVMLESLRKSTLAAQPKADSVQRKVE